MWKEIALTSQFWRIQSVAPGALEFGDSTEVVPHSGVARQSIPRGKRESQPGHVPNDLNTATPSPHTHTQTHTMFCFLKVEVAPGTAMLGTKPSPMDLTHATYSILLMLCFQNLSVGVYTCVLHTRCNLWKSAAFSFHHRGPVTQFWSSGMAAGALNHEPSHQSQQLVNP